MNWRRGLPVPMTVKSSPFSAGRAKSACKLFTKHTLGKVKLVDETGNDVAVLQVVVVVRAVDVGRDDARKAVAVLGAVSPSNTYSNKQSVSHARPAIFGGGKKWKRQNTC